MTERVSVCFVCPFVRTAPHTVQEAITTKRITLNFANSTDPPSSSHSSQFAVPSPLKSYVLTRHKKRATKTDQRSMAAGSPATPPLPSARAEGDAAEEDSDIAARRPGADLQHVCSWETGESEQRIRLSRRAGGGVALRHMTGPLYMSGQGAHIHQQKVQQDALKETVWTPNADLYYGKGIKAAHIKTKPPKPGASLGKSAQATSDMATTNTATVTG